MSYEGITELNIRRKCDTDLLRSELKEIDI